MEKRRRTDDEIIDDLVNELDDVKEQTKEKTSTPLERIMVKLQYWDFGKLIELIVIDQLLITAPSIFFNNAMKNKEYIIILDRPHKFILNILDYFRTRIYSELLKNVELSDVELLQNDLKFYGMDVSLYIMNLQICVIQNDPKIKKEKYLKDITYCIPPILYTKKEIKGYEIFSDIYYTRVLLRDNLKLLKNNKDGIVIIKKQKLYETPSFSKIRIIDIHKDEIYWDFFSDNEINDDDIYDYLDYKKNCYLEIVSIYRDEFNLIN